MDLKEYLTKLIQENLGVDAKDIVIYDPNSYEWEGKRFFIEVLDKNFDGDLDKGDPILEQYVLVPISKIQDRMDIILGE